MAEHRPTRAGAPQEGEGGGSSELAALSTLETLEAAYQLWTEQRLRHAAARSRHAEERRRLEDEAAFVLGAVRAAGEVSVGPRTAQPPTTEPGTGESVPAGPEAGALAPPGGLDTFVREAEQRLAEARSRLEQTVAEEEARFAQIFAQLHGLIRERVIRTLATTRPRLRMVPRRVGGDQRIVHLDRVTDDQAVLLLFVLTGQLPSRYGFLLDDSTDEVLLASPPLYPDEGIAPAQVRPGAPTLRRLLEDAAGVLPVKGHLPLLVPVPGAEPAFYRFLQRGPVMEVELAEGEAFRNLLTREEAERIAGHLLRLKLAGKLELELAAE